MKWLFKLFKPKPLETDSSVDELIWNHRVKLPTYDYANRHFEPQWMLQIRQDDLVKDKILEIIDRIPQEELLTANYNNETLLSLLIEKDESYLPVMKALIEKYPQTYAQQFKVKSLKSYIEYCLEKHNLPAYNYLLNLEETLKLNESQYENYIEQLIRFTKENNNILEEGLDKIDNLSTIPWEIIKSVFIELNTKNGQTKYLFGKAQQKAFLLLLNKNYFGDSLLSHLNLLFNLFDNTILSVTGDDEILSEIILKLNKSGIIPSVQFVEETFNYNLSLCQGQLYVYKFGHSLSQLGITNKRLVKSFYTKIFQSEGKIIKISESLIKCLLELKSIDPQILVPLVEAWDDGCQLSFLIKIKDNKKGNLSFSSLLKIYSPRRIVKILINEITNPSVKEYEFMDILSQSSILFNLCQELSLNPQDHFIQKPRSLHQIHENLWREISKLKNKNIRIRSFYPDDLIKLNGQTLDEYTIEIPEDSHRLVEVGNHLSICVGGGTYQNKIMNKETFIVLLLKEGKVEYCIELNLTQILQFKGHSNKDGVASPIYYSFKRLINY